VVADLILLLDVLFYNSGFLQVSENWKKSRNLSGQGKLRGKYFLDQSGKMKNWCHHMSDFPASNLISAGAPPQTPLRELTALPQTASCI